MLAQNFKSAVELAISEKHRDALIKTLVLFETGKLKHTSYYEGYISNGNFSGLFNISNSKFSGLFNMGCWRRRSPCGTVACIGGTAEMIGNVSFFYANCDTETELFKLFYPRVYYPLDMITVEQAARALRNYLSDSCADWQRVLWEG